MAPMGLRIALLSLLGAAPGTLPWAAAQDSPQDELRHRFEHLAREAIDGGAQGIALAVDVDGEILYAGGFGFSDPERGTAADAGASFRAGPMLGPFLAVVALRLAERGELELEAPLAGVLPELYPRTPEVTIDRLLTHTSGIPSYGGVLESIHHLARPFDPDPVLAWLADAPLESRPGTCAIYSNTNGFLLGLVLEKVGQQRVSELLAREVFTPAGMDDTGFRFERPTLRDAAHFAQEFGGGEVDPDDARPPFGAEGLCTTVLDLVRFQRALSDELLLATRMRELRAEPARLVDGTTSPVGRGVNLGRLGSYERQSAGGGMAHFRVHLAHYPERGATIAVLASGADAPAEPLERAVARALFGFESPVPRDLALTREQRAPYLGEYYAGCTSYGVTEAREHLVLVLPGGERHELLSQGEGHFVSGRDVDLTLEFVSEDGRPVALLLTERGVTLKAVRLL